jgi:hypothetical protein
MEYQKKEIIRNQSHGKLKVKFLKESDAATILGQENIQQDIDILALTAPKNVSIEAREPVKREPLTDERLKTIVTMYWNEYLEDNLLPLEAADLTISEVLGSSRITKGQWSSIFNYVADLYSKTDKYDTVYYKNLIIQAKELEQEYSE